MPFEVFWGLSPTELTAFYKAEVERQKRIDRHMWYMGQYFMSAIGACFGKNCRYPDKPFFEDAQTQGNQEEPNGEDLDRKQQKQLELLFAQLDVMGRNANLERKRKEQEEKAMGESGEMTEDGKIDPDNFEPYDLGEG